jgi:hypothetical protein
MKSAAAPLLIITLLSGPAHATDWSKISSNGTGTLYIDKRSVAAGAEGRKAWTLVSYQKVQTSADGKLYRSLKAQYLYVCGERSVTLLAQTFYPAGMARGEAVGNFKYEQYDAETPVAGSHTDSAYNYVCRRKLRPAPSHR